MRKTFFISLLALCLTASAWAVNVSNLADLQTALANGGEITLTANITATGAIVIDKATTINGGGFCIKNAATTDAIAINTNEAVVLNNLTIYAATTNNGRGIGINALSFNLTLNNVTINAIQRGITLNEDGYTGCTLTVNNSTIQKIHGLAVDANGNPTSVDYNTTVLAGNNYEHSRGISLWDMQNSDVVIDNTTIQGFYYAVNMTNQDFSGTTVTYQNNCVVRGRDAFNCHSENCTLNFNNSTVYGINWAGGTYESFASLVLDKKSTNVTLNITGATVYSVFVGAGKTNVNATQFLVANRGTNNRVNITNTDYTCPDEGGQDGKGGIVEYVGVGGVVTVDGGNYDCPELVGAIVSQGGSNAGQLIIISGNFETNVISEDMSDPDLYTGVEIQGGVYSADISVSDPTNPSNTLIVAGKAPFIRPDEMYEPLVADYVRPLRENIVFGTICLPKDGKMYGATLYEPAYKSGSMIFFAEIENDNIVGGKAYLFKANEGYSTIAAKYNNPANLDADLQKNGAMVGAYEQTSLSDPNKVDYYYVGHNYAIVRDNKYYRVNSDNVAIGAYCAYINLDHASLNDAPVPGRRYISFQDASVNEVTGIEDIEANENAGVQKVMINGQLYILRGEQIYNVAGQVVK
jgi:hypothetical protein